MNRANFAKILMLAIGVLGLTARQDAHGGVQFGRARVLIVGATESREGSSAEDYAALANLLRTKFSFENPVYLTGGDATSGAVISSLERFVATADPEDTIVMFLLLPISRPQAGLEALLVTADANRQDSYSGVPLFVLEKILAQASFQQALLVTPDCSTDIKGRHLGESLQYSGSIPRLSRLSILSMCPRIDTRSGTVFPPGLARTFTQSLSAAPRDGRRITASDLADTLTAAMQESVRFRVTTIPPRPGEDFAFVRSTIAASASSQPQFPNSKSVDDWDAAIFKIAENARYNTGNEYFVSQSATALADVARDRIPKREAPSLSKQQAVRALGTFPTEAAVAALSSIIRDARDPLVRRAAIVQLSQSGGSTDLAVIREVLADRDPAIQLTAIRALAIRKDPQSADLFAGLLDSGRLNSENKVAALQGLAGYSRASDNILFARHLTDPMFDVRRAAISGMRTDITTENVEAFLQRLRSDEYDEVRVQAAYAIGRGKSALTAASLKDRALDELIRAAGRGTVELNTASSWALGELGSTAAPVVDSLCTGIRSDSEDKRVSAIEALGKLRAGKCLADIQRSASEGTQAVRKASVTALGFIGDESSREALAKAQTDSDSDVAAAAREAMAMLVQGGDVDQLIAALADEAKETRAAAADELAGYKDAASLTKMFAALTNPNARVRINLVTALAENPDARVTEKLIERLRDEETQSVRIELIQSLARRDFEQVSATLLELAAAPTVPIRKAVAETLGTYATKPDAASCLEVLKVDPSPAVRLPALELLAKVGGVGGSQAGTSPTVVNSNVALSCRPVPLLGWSAAKPKAFYPAPIRLIDVTENRQVTRLTADTRLEPLVLKGRRWAEFEFSGKANVTTGVSLLMNLELDSNAGDQVIFAKVDAQEDLGSWFLAIREGRLRFGVMDEASRRSRIVQTQVLVLPAGRRTTIAATFDVVEQVMRIFVGGTEVATSPEPDDRQEIVRIFQSAADVRIGMPYPSLNDTDAVLRGTVFEVAYFGWALPPALIATMSRP